MQRKKVGECWVCVIFFVRLAPHVVCFVMCVGGVMWGLESPPPLSKGLRAKPLNFLFLFLVRVIPTFRDN
jgi:hypothetical protein